MSLGVREHKFLALKTSTQRRIIELVDSVADPASSRVLIWITPEEEQRNTVHRNTQDVITFWLFVRSNLFVNAKPYLV